MNSLSRRRELAEFLRNRRQQVDPSDHGLQPGRRRRSGLRREEVAAIANVSLTWYTWLEQARDIHASAEVLTSIGRALMLTAPETDYLQYLGGFGLVGEPRGGRSDPFADPQLAALTASLRPNPASIITPSFDYVAWNRASESLVPGFLGCDGDLGHNLIRFIFREHIDLEPGCGTGDYARSVVAQLRMNAARYAGDDTIGELTEEVSAASPQFAGLWQRGDVRPADPRDVAIPHPDLGVLAFRQSLLTLQAYPDLTLVVFLPADGATAAQLPELVAAG